MWLYAMLHTDTPSYTSTLCVMGTIVKCYSSKLIKVASKLKVFGEIFLLN